MICKITFSDRKFQFFSIEIMAIIHYFGFGVICEGEDEFSLFTITIKIIDVVYNS